MKGTKRKGKTDGCRPGNVEGVVSGVSRSENFQLVRGWI